MSMRALVLTGIGQLEVQSRPQLPPNSDEVVIRVVATGICGSDIHGYSGDTGRRFPGQVMGHETSGRVEHVGRDVDPEAFPIGALVTFNPVLSCGTCAACLAGNEPACIAMRVIGVDPSIQASFAEFISVPMRNVVRLADSLRPDLGALVEPLAVGYHAARRGGCGPDDRVAVIGGGPIGQACYLGARRFGADRIVVSEISRTRRAVIERLGGQAVEPGGDEFVDRVGALLGGPADLVLDAVGSTSSLQDAVSVSAKGGRVVLVGMNSPTLTLNAYDWSTQERSITGSFCYSAADFVATAAWAGEHSDVLGGLVDGHVDLDGAAAAFAGLAGGTMDASKVLVCPHGKEPG